jgi:hypothetical protein
MKFERKYPNATSTDRFEFDYSYVTKTPKLGKCRRCDAYTKWFDVLFMQHACSEECLGAMWTQYKQDQKQQSTYHNFESHFDMVKSELKMIEQASEVWKDIIIVVHDQLDYLKQCIESLKEHTKHCHIYIWDNGSRPETADYISNLVLSHDPDASPDWLVTSMRSDVNTGFIQPNNELVAWGESEYIILLNSDTKVFAGWDKAMTGFLEQNPDVAQVGFWGGHMGPDGRGFGGANGSEVDYIPGWCFCISRKTYEKHGLFNKQLTFAYCEDADLSLRLKEAGKKIYALYSPLVHHYQNKTIIEVEKEGQINVAASFESNHQFMKSRWKHYIENERVLLKKAINSEAVNGSSELDNSIQNHEISV